MKKLNNIWIDRMLELNHCNRDVHGAAICRTIQAVLVMYYQDKDIEIGNHLCSLISIHSNAFHWL